MSTIAELDARIAELETAISTVAAGRVAQWGDRMITMERMPELRAARTEAIRERSALRRAAAGDTSSARYRVARFL